MVKVDIKKDKIIVLGHSNYNDYGKDIVCASISSIVITTINALLKIDENCIKYEDNDGYVEITILKHDKYIDILIGNMIDLLKELEKQYKKILK